MRRKVLLTVALCTTWGFAMAADPSKEDQSLQAAAASVDQQASQTEGQQTVISRLESRFNVDATRIDGLRSQGLGFGEVAIVLALAQKMAGGITDANVQSIMTMRTGPPTMGWGEIAKKLGEKLGPVVSQVNSVSGRSHEGGSGADHGAQTDRPNRPDKPEKPGKP